MFYFWLVMASTLWVSSVLGDDRLAIGAVLIGTWVLPLLIRRLRRKFATTAVRPRPALRVAQRSHGRRWSPPAAAELARSGAAQLRRAPHRANARPESTAAAAPPAACTAESDT